LTPIGRGWFKAPALEVLLNAIIITKDGNVKGFLLKVG
jgi:hypothetical protein